MARDLAAHGHQVVGPGAEVDLCIFNSCTVTNIASRKSRRFIRQLRTRYPSAAIVVTGCHAELSPDEVRALGVDRIVGNCDKEDIPAILRREGLLGESTCGDRPPAQLSPGHGVRTRAFLKVQDGCDNRCAYCVVTVARGDGRSLPPDRVIEEVRALLRAGHVEVVLSGVHLGSYGHDLGDRRGLFDLAGRVLAETDVLRLRLSSVEPWDLDDGFFAIFDHSRVMPHLHLPLQSGSDYILKRMARRCTSSDYARLVKVARDRVSDLAISTDIMVGFPGESDEHHQQSISFVEEIGFSRLHIFRFSPRPGTPAACLDEQTAGPVSQERSRQMHALGGRLEERFREQQLGRTVAVLWEERESAPAERRWIGFSPNYQRVVAETEEELDLANLVTETRLTHTIPGALVGEIVGSSRRRSLPVANR